MSRASHNLRPLRHHPSSWPCPRYYIIAAVPMMHLSLLLIFLCFRTRCSAFIGSNSCGFKQCTVNSSSKSLDTNNLNEHASNITSDTSTITSSDTRTNKRWRIPILSYKNNYVIVSKPAGVSMHRNANHWGYAAKSPSLEKLIRKQLARKPYLVHRLDHRTSGAVIMGFDSQTAGRLHGRMRGDKAIKLYVALVRGDLREKFANANDTPIGENLHDILPEISGAQAMPSTAGHGSCGKITIDLPIKVDEIEKDATTDFYFLSALDLNERLNPQDKPINRAVVPFLNKSLTLLLCRTRTGRTHQIRRHLQKGLNAPIIGDSEHGDSRVNRFWRETIGLDRLALHCWYLELPPGGHNNDVDAVDDNQRLESESTIQCLAPLPEDLIGPLQNKEINDLWREALNVEKRLDLEPYDEKGGTFGRHYRSKQGLKNA